MLLVYEKRCDGSIDFGFGFGFAYFSAKETFSFFSVAGCVCACWENAQCVPCSSRASGFRCVQLETCQSLKAECVVRAIRWNRWKWYLLLFALKRRPCGWQRRRRQLWRRRWPGTVTAARTSHIIVCLDFFFLSGECVRLWGCVQSARYLSASAQNQWVFTLYLEHEREEIERIHTKKEAKQRENNNAYLLSW